MTVHKISVASTEYAKAVVRLREGGRYVNPTARTVKATLTAIDAKPDDDTTWSTASWETDGSRFVARVLVGPTGGVVNPAVGTYVLWFKITSSPEDVVMRSGPLVIE